MTAKSLDSFLEIGADIFGSTKNEVNNMVSVQLGDTINQRVIADNAEWWQQVGFCSMPAIGKAGESGCQALAIAGGSYYSVFATRDTRAGAIYGELKPGETCLYASGPDASNLGTGRVFLKDDGTISTISMVCQKDNESSGVPVIIQASSEGKIILNAGENGAISMDENGIKAISNKDVQIGATENVAVIGQSIALNGANVSLGANATDLVVLANNLMTYIGYLETTLIAFKTALASGSFIVTPNPALAALTASLALFDPITNPGITSTIAGIPSTSVFAAA